MHARAGGACTSNSNNTNVTYNYNTYYNGTVAVMGANDKVADPQFITLSTDPSTTNFSLKTTSPAIDAGTQTLFAAKDITGNARPKRTTVDCGAYEID